MVQPTDRRKQFDSLAAAAVIVAAVGIWSKLVADIVPEPYLVRIIQRDMLLSSINSSRTRCSMSVKQPNTLKATGGFGIPRSLLLLACRYLYYVNLAPHIS